MQQVIYQRPEPWKICKGGMHMKINKDMLIGELVQIDDVIPNILMRAGMHCLG